MKIAPYDTYITREFEDDESYQAFLDDESYYGVIPFKPKRLPMNSWTIPFVTNHRYRIHWAEGMDFTQMRIQLSDRWETTDSNILINMNFTDVREAINFTSNWGWGD